MVALPGSLRGRPDQPARFSDETSPDSRQTGGQKVPVYATVARDTPIGWYHDLVAYFPDASGEVKSSRILRGFEDLPSNIQARVWKGLREVAIHVSDPRPYLGFFDGAFEEGLGRKFPERELMERRKRGDKVATYLLEERERRTAQTMLYDSVERRLRDMVRSAADRSMVAPPWDSELQDPSADDFKKGKASVLRQVAEYTAKGSAAFAPAHERATTHLDEEKFQRFWTGPDSADLINRGTLKELEDGHAFDRGNAKSVAALEKDRRAMVEHLLGTGFYTLDDAAPREGQGLIEMDSKEDARIQAADVAAGMARQILVRDGMQGLVKRWDSVHYNGSRITENNLEETMRFWSRV